MRLVVRPSEEVAKLELTRRPAASTIDGYPHAMPILKRPPLDALPIPRDLESRDEFTKRYLDHPTLRRAPGAPYTKKRSADSAWEQARLRSQVSIKNSAGEWLLFS